ncbi:MAG TPA: OmpA family protein [Spirochaetia bacterium]|nr:OmpA family protein [Spirochaetia bacterium]
MIKLRTVFLVWLLIALVVSGGALYSETFQFKYTKGDQYHIITEVTENVFIDGEFNNRAEILNKISVEVQDVREHSGYLSGQFQVSQKAWGEVGPYRLIDETFTSRFWRDRWGRYDIEPGYLMPIVRNIPHFPDSELAPGDAWRSPAEEVHDLRDYGIAQPLHIPLDVFYTYRGRVNQDGRELAIFDIQYSASKSLRGVPDSVGLVPLKIKGSSQQTYYWDLDKGRPFSYQDRFDYVYILSNGRSVEFEGTSNGRVIQVSRLEKEKVARDIQKEIEKRGIRDTVVNTDEQGVTITLENINFPPDSAFLAPEERAKLDTIGEILKNYPERDLMVVGHTALAGTEKGREMLSERRAEAVGRYLLSKGIHEENQITYKGMGATQPIADNSTEEGMRKNRRVEIKILEN